VWDRIRVTEGDITKMKVDAIVNAASPTLLGGGGVDGAIHRAAGPDMLDQCRRRNGCKTGDAKVTDGFRLPARWVIHTVGPVWKGGDADERSLLASCYRRSLEQAERVDAKTLAFSAISTGVYGYPKELAVEVAVDVIAEWLEEHEVPETVILCTFQADSTSLAEQELARRRG
jgi:O-acetyl-ADP-ribose deacetylase (regulator of RNase III)